MESKLKEKFLCPKCLIGATETEGVPCDSCLQYPDRRIKDSGARIEFSSGAVRDIQEGKGRCDLLPLGVIANFMEDSILLFMNEYKERGQIGSLYSVLKEAPSKLKFSSYPIMFLEVSKHFEEGAKKYGENNWQKGIPICSYIDSAIRHYLKFINGDQDEPHDRAFVWNILCAIWTHTNKPEFIGFLGKKEVEE